MFVRNWGKSYQMILACEKDFDRISVDEIFDGFAVKSFALQKCLLHN